MREGRAQGSMRRGGGVLILALTAAALLPGGTAAALAASAVRPAPERWTVLERIKGPDGMWDYASVGRGRLYVAHSGRISAMTLAAPHTWSELDSGRSVWHAVVPITGGRELIATDGLSHRVVLIDAVSGAKLAAMATGGGGPSRLAGKLAAYAALSDPDALAVDSRSGLAVVVNGGSGEVIFIDLARREIVGRTDVGGKLEYAVTDGEGRLYVDVETAAEIAVIDVARRAVVGRIALPGCKHPQGLGYDSAARRLIASCANGVAEFVDTAGRLEARVPIGKGSDAVIVDESRRLAFVPSGEDGTLAIFDLRDSERVRLIARITTEKSARLGAVDPRTGLLYLPAATLGPPVAPAPWPSAVAGTFHVLVVGPVRSHPHAP